MLLKLGLLLSVAALVTVAHTVDQICPEPFQVKFQWNYINYTWPSKEAYDWATGNGSYVEKNNVISGVRVYKDRIYLTIPRRKSGIPVTLASISAEPIIGETAPLLEPFPNWGMQQVGKCRAFQFVQNVEIDPEGRMWVLDTGRARNATGEYHCPPRLVILDLDKKGKVLKKFPLPASVANPRTAYLYDILLDNEDGGYAYISDADPKKPGIIVFSLRNQTFWKVSHRSMFASEDAIGFSVGTTRVNQSFNIHGMTLWPAGHRDNDYDRLLYFSPLSSYSMYTIATSVLKNGTRRADFYVKHLGKKPSQTDGITMTNKGIMYFGLLGNDSISQWDADSPGIMYGQCLVSRDHDLMQWPASFSIGSGYIWVVSNRLHLFLNDAISLKEPNFRIVASKTKFKNYQYLVNGTAPVLPDIK